MSEVAASEEPTCPAIPLVRSPTQSMTSRALVVPPRTIDHDRPGSGIGAGEDVDGVTARQPLVATGARQRVTQGREHAGGLDDGILGAVQTATDVTADGGVQLADLGRLEQPEAPSLRRRALRLLRP